MKNIDEDYAYEQRRQARIDTDWAGRPCELDISEHGIGLKGIPIHQKVGTVIPFSRTVDKDPNPRIPLSVPENSYPKVSKKEAVFWFVIGAVLVAWWTGVL